jgi:co-chaperonin GroES (HSP10)
MDGVLRMTNESGLVPVEFFVVVALDPAEEKVGSIIVPQSVQEKDKLSCQEGTLIAVSPLAFTYEQWPEGSRKPQLGERVLFRRYAGALHERTIGGVKRDFRLLNDKDIIAIVEAPPKALQEAA